MDDSIVSVIGRIYDAVIDPTRWEFALDTVRSRHGWHNSALTAIALPERRFIVNTVVNVPPGLYDIPTMDEDLVAMWGGPARLAQAPLQEPHMQSHQSDASTWHKYATVREWSAPQGIVDQVGIILARDRTIMSTLGFAQHESMTEVPEWALEELRVLAPHFARAVLISGLLKRSAALAATFEAALDATPAGALLVRGDMGIVHANTAADRMLAEADSIRSVQGRLRPTEELVPGQLESAVEAAEAGAGAIGRRGIGIPMRRRDGSPVVAHVMPLEGRGNVPVEAAAAVFLADTGGAEPMPSERLRLLFDLTPAETRVFEMAAAGESPEQMAGKLGIAPSTVRTHLQRVYEKTGRHRQVELVTLGRELKLPL